MSTPYAFAHSGKNSGSFGSKPIRVTFPFESNFTIFFAAASSCAGFAGLSQPYPVDEL